MALPHNTSVVGQLRGIATRPAKRAGMITHAQSIIQTRAGVDGDFGRRPGKAQVTVLSEEAWRVACEESGAGLPWTARRANLLVAGIPLQPLIGARIAIGEVLLEVTAETDPCWRMADAHPGLMRALSRQARGGVRCRVLAGGAIAVGDQVTWMLAMEDLFGPLSLVQTQRAAQA